MSILSRIRALFDTLISRKTATGEQLEQREPDPPPLDFTNPEIKAIVSTPSRSNPWLRGY